MAKHENTKQEENKIKDKKKKISKKKYEEMSEDEKISFHTKRLNRQFSKLDTKTKNIVKSLIGNVAFMTVTLEELQQAIKENGITIEYKNGANQWGTKKSPEAEMYNTMIKNLATITKQLSDLVPKDVGTNNDDGFDDFVKDKP